VTFLPAVLCIPLTIIFTKSLSEGALPVDWKLANIIQKENKASPCSYQLVSLTSVVSKVLKSIVQETMIDHLFKNKLMSSNYITSMVFFLANHV